MIQKLLGLQAEAKKRFLAAQTAGKFHSSYTFRGICADERGILAVGESADGYVHSASFSTSVAGFLVIPAGDDLLADAPKKFLLVSTGTNGLGSWAHVIELGRDYPVKFYFPDFAESGLEVLGIFPSREGAEVEAAKRGLEVRPL